MINIKKKKIIMTYAISGEIWYHTYYVRGNQRLRITYGHVDTVLCSKYSGGEKEGNDDPYDFDLPSQDVVINSVDVLNPRMDKYLEDYSLEGGDSLSSEESSAIESVINNEDSAGLLEYLKIKKWHFEFGEYYCIDSEIKSVGDSEAADIKSYQRVNEEIARIISLSRGQ